MSDTVLSASRSKPYTAAAFSLNIRRASAAGDVLGAEGGFRCSSRCRDAGTLECGKSMPIIILVHADAMAGAYLAREKIDEPR